MSQGKSKGFVNDLRMLV